MSSFGTTSSRLFDGKNRESIPEWMTGIGDLELKPKHEIDLDFERRGAFNEGQRVYRPDVVGTPKDIREQCYTDSKLIVESKIELAKFLTGKYYRVVDERAGVDGATLSVRIDGIDSVLRFPFRVRNGKLTRNDVFYANNGEYPFSRAGLEECLSDVKTGRVRESKPVEAIGKVYVISREEIVRRFNGMLRPATDKINQLLKDGIILGAGSNQYVSLYDVDQLFPKVEGEKPDDRSPEFHFVPNAEHVAANPHKTADVLTLEANSILDDYFDDFKITSSVRDGNELLVKATVLGKMGLREDIDFSFALEGERVAGIKLAEVNDRRMTIEQLMDYLGSMDRSVLSRYLSLRDKRATKHIYSGVILTSREIKSKLLKVIESDRVEGVINEWIRSGYLTPVNSTTYATRYTFEELLNTLDVDPLSDERTMEIETAQRHFGEGLDIDTETGKPLETIREVEDRDNDEFKLINANRYLSTRLKRYRVASFKPLSDGRYELRIKLINTKTGMRHDIPFTFTFEGNKVVDCVAHLYGKTVSIDKLANAFSESPILSLYLRDKDDNLTAGPIVISLNGMKRKLASVIKATEIDNVINGWLRSGLVFRIDGNTLTSPYSLEELLSRIDYRDVIPVDERERIRYQGKRNKDLLVKTDLRINDTGVREADDKWTSERKRVFASSEINKIFKDYVTLGDYEDDGFYYVDVNAVNPFNGVTTRLTFKFSKESYRLGELITVSCDGEEVGIDKIGDLLERHATATQRYFVSNDRVDGRIHSRNLISKANLINRLSVVVDPSRVPRIVNDLVRRGLMQPINSVTYASDHTVSELVSMIKELDLDTALIRTQLATRNDYMVSLDDKRVMDSDTRVLEPTTNHLTPKAIEARENLMRLIDGSLRLKRITAKKADELVTKLNAAKTVLDLERVTRELRRYLKS